MSGASPADKGRKRPKKESRQERRRIKGSGKGKKDEKNEEEEGQPKGGHGRSANLYHDLDVGSSLDDLTKAAVYRNPLLGDHNCWGEAKLEAIDLVAIADGETDTGQGIWDGAREALAVGDADDSYVLNPMAGMGDHGAMWVMVSVTKAIKEGPKRAAGAEEEAEEEPDSEEAVKHPWWKCWGKEDPWENFASTVNTLIKLPPPEPETNPFRGVAESATLWEQLTDEPMKELIRTALPSMSDACAASYHEIVDKVDEGEALRRTVAATENVYDMKPMLVKQFIRTIPTTGERFERLNVKIFITDKHLLFWDESTTKAVRIEPLPIMGVYELLRYDIVHQRVDDMLMYPVPLNAVKGYTLEVSVESHAIAHVDTVRSKECLVVAIVALSLCFMCYFVGRFEHKIIVVDDDSGSSAGAEMEELDQLGQHAADLARDFFRTRWFIFVISAVVVAYSVWFLVERPQIRISPPTPYKHEDRKVMLGAREPLTLEHMVLEMHLDDNYSTVEAKEFLRVMQITSPHLSGQLMGKVADADKDAFKAATQQLDLSKQ